MLAGPLVQCLANFLQLFPLPEHMMALVPPRFGYSLLISSATSQLLGATIATPSTGERDREGRYTASERTRRARGQKSERGDFLAPDAPQGAQPRVRTELHLRAR